MPRLPTIGEQPYGAVFLDWLHVAHHDDGSLKGVIPIFNVEDYGGANPTDNDRFTGALEAANAAGGGIVQAAPRTYNGLNALIYGNTLLRGCGWKTVLKSASSANPILKGTDPVVGTVMGVGIEDLVVDGTDRTDGVTGLYWTRYAAGPPVTSARSNYFKNLRVLNCDVGARFIDDQGIGIYNCHFESNHYGILATDNSELALLDQCQFRYNGNPADPTDGAGVRLENSSPVIGSPEGIYGWKFNRCHWEANYAHGAVLDGAGSNDFDTCKWEQNNGDGVRQVTENALTRPDGNSFKNCIWNGNPSHPTARHFYLDRGRLTTFLGGSFNPASTGGVVIGANAIDTFFFHTLLDPAILSDSSGSTWSIGGGFGKTRIPYATNHLSAWMTNSGGVVSLGTLPPFINVTNVRIQVTTAFDGTTPKISVGTAGNNTLFCAATDISTIGIKAPVLNVMGYYDATIQPTNIYYTGGASLTGRALVILEYETVTNRP